MKTGFASLRRAGAGVAGSEGTWDERAEACGWRWCAGVLVGALDEIYPDTRHQRCWVHKTANVLNALPKSAQPKAKEALHEIWMAETQADAQRAFDQFIHTYQDKYLKATECLEKDREELLAFYDFPAVHWLSLRTTNPIESTFATIRHRTRRSKGCLSRKGMLAGSVCAAQLAQVARIQATWQSDRRYTIQRRD